MKTKAKPNPKPARPIVVPPDTACLLSIHQVAACLDLSPRMARQLVQTGRIPPPTTTIGRVRRWHRDEFNRWLESRKGKEI